MIKIPLKGDASMNLNGSETLKNLARAFAGESQARNRYDFIGGQLRREGYEYLYRVISEIAHNEHAHAKIFWKYIIDNENNGYPNIEFNAGYPFVGGKSVINLESAALGESHEANEIYPGFAQIAKNEGFDQIAASFEQIAKIESEHNKIFERMKIELENGTLYNKTSPYKWKCENCGHEFDGNSVPSVCPVCQHPTGYFTTPLK